MVGESERELNRTLLSAWRKVEKKTRLRAQWAWDLLLRWGIPGERYVFNPSRQTIELADLLCVCRKVDGVWVPCGNPVKDSMATKTSAATTQVVAVIDAPIEEPPGDLREAAERFASLLATHCGATQTGFELFQGRGGRR